MIYRIYPIKDCFITNDSRSWPGSTVRQTGSNVGQSEELQVFKKAGISGAIGTMASSSLARTLLQWDFSQYSALTASAKISASGSTWRLRLVHKTSNDALPFSYDMTVLPVAGNWDEGRGLDIDDLADVGAASWIYRQQSIAWTNAGGDFLASPTASVHFDTGYEDVDLDLTTMVGSWLTGGLTNNGLALTMTGSVENDLNFNNYYTKKFYSRQTSYPDRAPFLEARSQDFLLDDRLNMAWNESGSLFLYNVNHGQLSDLPTPVIMTVADVSGNVVVSTTASHVSLGIYSASFVAASSSVFSGSTFYDSWKAGGGGVMTSSFSFFTDGAVSTTAQSQITARIRNLRTEYSTDDIVRFEVFFRRRHNALPVVQTASLGTPPYIVTKGYYAIENDSTRQRVVPFLTSSDETRLSYDGSGNYFNFYMSNLQPQNVYRLVFMVDELGRKQIIDPGLRFKVV